MYFRKKIMQAFIKSFYYAMSGVCQSWQMGRNFRVQIVLGFVALGLCITLNFLIWEWIVVLILIGGVLSLETINSSIEKLCDLISMDIDPRIKTIKDLSAGAVLIFSVIALVIGCLIFIPKIILIFS
jgi:diacylglycerol kinase